MSLSFRDCVKLVQPLIEAMERMDEQARTEVFDELADHYCRDCGRELYDGDGDWTDCSCTNDE